MALAHGDAVACHQLPEKFYARIAAEFFAHGPEPLLILRLDAELALPLGIGQVAVSAGQVMLFDEARVVRLYPDRQDRRHPFPVARNGTLDKLLEIRRSDRLKNLFAVQRFHFRGTEMDHVDVETPPGCLAQGALQHLVGPGTPDIDLDAVLFLEGPDDGDKVLLRDGRVESDRSFFPGGSEQLAVAVRALILEQRSVRRAFLLGHSVRHERRRQQPKDPRLQVRTARGYGRDRGRTSMALARRGTTPSRTALARRPIRRRRACAPPRADPRSSAMRDSLPPPGAARARRGGACAPGAHSSRRRAPRSRRSRRSRRAAAAAPATAPPARRARRRGFLRSSPGRAARNASPGPRATGTLRLSPL